MEEYFTYTDALALAQSFYHLKGTTFVDSDSRIEYSVFTILPIPASSEEQEEMRDIMAEFIEGAGANKWQLDAFEARVREDKFLVSLLGIGFPRQGLNLLLVSVRQFVDQEGQIRYGFPVHRDIHFF